MNVIAVVGHSNAGKTTLVEGLVDALAERGPVGTVKHIDCEPDLDTDGKDTARHRAAGAVRTHGISESGWFGTGEHRPLGDALDDLAPDCEYAVVEGYRSLSLPKILLGDADADGVRLAAPRADAVDIDDAVTAVESVPSYETLDSLVASVETEDDGVTATATGVVDEAGKKDDVVDERASVVREDVQTRDSVVGVRIHRRTGFAGTDDSRVFVAVRAHTAGAAFRAVEEAVDRLGVASVGDRSAGADEF